MQTSLRRRSRLARPLSWLVVAGLAGAALIGPGAGGVAASDEPGSPDFVPNSGNTSSSGLTLAMGTATIECDGDTTSSFNGSFTFSGNEAGDHVVVYLAANNGSNADPLDNVQDNELTIDLAGETSPVSFSIPITSGFTATKGGILIVFASDVSGTQAYSSKSNSLNCSDSETTTSSSTSDTTTSGTTTSDTTTSDTTTSDTTTSDTTTSDTTTSDTTTSDTTTSDTTTSDTTTSLTSTGSESETSSTSSTDTSASSTGTESGISSTSTSTSEGGELAETGTPGLTPPSTDTVSAVPTTGSPDGFRFILLGLAFLLAMVLLLQPRDVASRR